MLPNSKNAWISSAKITQYLLSVTHPVGKSKARFFRACGYHLGNHETFMRDLLKVARTGQVTQFMHSSHGEKYVVEGDLMTPNGTNIVLRTVWIIEDGHRPRFVTAYPP